MRRIISQVVDAIDDELSTSDIEDVCRAEVADTIEDKGRLLTCDEMENMLEPIVHDETVVVPEEHIDGDIISVTENEYDALEDGAKVEEAGVKKVLHAGKLYTAHITNDPTAKNLAYMFDREMKSAAQLIKMNSDIPYDIDSLYVSDKGAEPVCRVCGSKDMTVFYVDGGSVAAHCNTCEHDAEYTFAELDMDEPASVQDRTIEDIDIIPEICLYMSVWYDDDCGEYAYELCAGDEIIDSGCVATYEDAEQLAEEVAMSYDDVDDRVEVMSCKSGKKMTIVSADDFTFTDAFGHTGNRARLAARIAAGDMTISQGSRYSDKVRAGYEYKQARGGNIIDVLAVKDGKVRYIEHDAHHSYDTTEDMTQLPQQSFLAHIERGGFELLI